MTLQKRVQNLKDIGVSVTAFTGDQIHKLGFQRPKDLAAQTPGLFTKSRLGDTGPNFTIRGIGLSDFVSINNSPTSVYIDEVLRLFHPMVNFSLFDMGRIERTAENMRRHS